MTDNDGDTEHSVDYYKSLKPFPLSGSDHWLLTHTDRDVHPHEWEELCDFIASNQLALLKRSPSELRKYIVWCSSMARTDSGIINWFALNRLPWGLPPFEHCKSTTPFENTNDFRILWNDWPYNLAPDIKHLVVWTRTPLPTDMEHGDITKDCRQAIKDFVARCFEDRLGTGNVLWFRNWTSLQSIRALEHIHVLVRGASEQDLKQWTRYETRPDRNRPPDTM